MHSVWHIGKYGLETLLSSIQFFYCHLSLVLISLIPSSLRAYQMWNPLDTPFWLEIVVELTRAILILIMICLMSKVSIGALRRKKFWDGIGNLLTNQFKKNWPYHFIAQILVFLVLLYGAGNLLLQIISDALISVIEMLDLESYGYSTAYNACLFFLKNMSVIPLAMVYILKVCGLRPTNH